ncbi:hypothetical protein GB931_10665 [Modestobacter sp. I12A-02628]|uniref:Uncharacterized protein n=1 Tax=Goekera deserti TaxID=2497753 RepID=A0A7K3WC68_9ACTN|nr:hypothetical protein [Goekera deserti]MPQ98371.1 hypothetical protein [Goekera deserti]NDI48198.1 hypothetical protein [Goekera deserti]NEL53947.1 hypothetical protein [Goekera deserti]
MFEVGSRERTLPAPVPVVWESLTRPRRPGARPWLHLLDDEVEPTVLYASAPVLLVWSSAWPRWPQLVTVLELRRTGLESALSWTATAPDDPCDDGLVGHVRLRLNRLLWADLRLSYG